MSGSVDVRFQVLGPWAVTSADGPVSIPVGRMQVLLASLIVSVGQWVSTDTLAEQVWPERMPARVRATFHTYVARLRRLLGHDAIETAPGCYRLAVPAERIDLWRFRDLLRRAATAGTAERELTLLREALSLWRGSPFAGLASTWLDREVVPRLRDEWFSATERRIDLEMRADNPGNLVPELRDLVRAYPTRESLWLLLIEALHRCGRRAEALDAYQEVRAVLTEELGIEPGDALQRTHRQVLLDGSAPDLAAPTRQLPHDIASFSGRGELARLNQLMASIAGSDRRVTRIVAIEGAPGAGKTTLAVHWAHQVAGAYPDRQLYLDLRGHGPSDPMTPAAAAETLLRGLGVPEGAIPAGADERGALLRSTLAGQRVLMLLDNARDAEQVRPLLPGSDGLVVVTSRNQLRGLSIRDGAHRVTLGPLPAHEALDLLASIVGPARVAAEPVAATRLVEICDGLPLALAIAAERAQRSGGLAAVVEALSDERLRHTVLGDGEGDPHTDLWAAFSWSYRALGPAAAAMFRRLGLHPVDDFTAETVAALAGMPQRAAEHALDQLVAAHLVQERHPRRYELRGLIRWYAMEQAVRDEVPDAGLPWPVPIELREWAQRAGEEYALHRMG